ncbi:MAG: ATPase domain-containing protein [archaeon]
MPSKKVKEKQTTQEQQTQPEKKIVNFVTSGIKEIDDAFGKGLPVPGVYLVLGPPGSGKTPFCLAFASENAKAGKRVLYLCTNNFPEELIRIGKEIGYDVSNVVFIDSYSWLVGKKADEYVGSLANLSNYLEKIENLLKEEESEVVVLDTLSTLYLYHDSKEVAKFLQMFAALIKCGNDCALIALEAGTTSESDVKTAEYLTDGTFLIENRTINITRTPGIRVLQNKLRFEITPKGIIIKK